MGIKLDQINDPKLRQRILDAEASPPYRKLLGNKYAAKNHDHSPCRALPDTKPQRDKAPALGAAVERETQGLGRIAVRFTGFRTRPVDPDNFYVKDLLDGLRHAGLIPDDAWACIRLETQQTRVAHLKDECTEIVIEYPDL